MPAYVPGYHHDIFVSYAHVDNEKPPVGVEKGWVSYLVDLVKYYLNQKLGRKEIYSLWMDYELSRHEGITPAILESLEGSATLMVVLSPGYLASEWCEREKTAFLGSVAQQVRGGSRVFVVERDRVDTRPEEFGDLLGYRFWVEDDGTSRTLGVPLPQPTEDRYFSQVNKLTADLAAELNALKSAAGARAEAAAPGDPEARTVFLALTGPDLDEARESTRDYLDQAGIRVLPRTVYPAESAAFESELRRDLATCDLFVQLLGGADAAASLPAGFARIQHQEAAAKGKPVLQWRSRDLDPGAVTDGAHRELLEGEEVIATGLEELKKEVLRRLAPEKAAGAGAASGFVFVNHEAGDRELAVEVARCLEERDVGYALPLQDCASAREDLLSNLADCDAVLLVRGQAPLDWVRRQIVFVRKYLPEREHPLRSLAVLHGPAAAAEPVGIRLPSRQAARMPELDSARGVAAAVEEFLAGLGSPSS